LWKGLDDLTVALICPPDDHRSMANEALNACGVEEVHKFSLTSSRFVEMPAMLNRKYDVVLIDLEGDPELALTLIEKVSAEGRASVLAYSSKPDPDMLMRCMIAGAREFLRSPFEQRSLSEALYRAASRRPGSQAIPEKRGKILFFLGAKGGAGVSTVACNFAIALAGQPAHKTLLIDLDLPLGDVALNLGLLAPYSVLDALKDSKRLDAHLLSSLLVNHPSGLSVLVAPGRFMPYQAQSKEIVRLLEVARQEFDNVVVDLGSKYDFMESAVLDMAHTTYLVTQTGVAELRNSNRLIEQFFSDYKPRLEIVLNRHSPSLTGLSEENMYRVLGREIKWKIPNDYAAVRKMQTNATPLLKSKSPILPQIRKMCASLDSPGDAQPAEKRSAWFPWKVRLSQAAAI
jgi:pilus assembly protein CpaE